MKNHPIKVLLWFVVFFAVVGLACGMPSSSEEPSEIKGDEASVKDVSEKEPVEKEPDVEKPTGAVTNYLDAQQAVIQIEAQGTFVDPEWGEYTGAGRGSGFIIDPSGIAVTNNHVVTGAALLKVWIGGDTSQTYNARILGVSECSDLAVIDIEGEGFPYLEWYGDPINVGLEVYTAGFPLGDPEYTLTKGIVSKENADGETIWASVDSVIMHDATINPGNSGGPLIDENGNVVGVNYAAYKAADQYFAIGRDVAVSVINRLRAGENVDSLGINGTGVVSEDGTLSGIWVSSVQSGSPADVTGITGGDIVTSLESLPMAADGTMADYCDVIRTHSPGDTLAVEILRFSSYELLEGQINGRALSQSFSFADTLDDQVDTTESGETYTTSDYVAVYDDTEAIVMEVPGAWYYTGAVWEATWGDLSFKAANIVAAPNLDDYYNYWGASGVDFAASKDWGDIGGYVQLLDSARDTWYEGNCDLDGRYDYDDSFYEGQYDIWLCGSDATVLVLAARPIADPFAYLTLVQVQIATDADLDVLERILDTFDVVGRLP
jgi:serine protease Do